MATCNDSETRDLISHTAAAIWRQKDPKKLAEFAEKNFTGDAKGLAMQDAVNALLHEGDTASASGIVDAMPYGLKRTAAIASVASALANNDTSGALRWGASLSLKEDREKAFSAVAQRLYLKGDVNALVDLANSDAVDGSLRGGLVHEAADLTVKKLGIDAAKNWVNSLSEADKASATAGLVDALAPTDPAAATAMVKTLTGQMRVSAYDSIRNNLADRDPAEAAKWVTTLSGDDQSSNARMLVLRWYNTDSLALSTWVNGLPPGPLKNVSQREEARALMGSDRHTAVQVIQGIGDPAARKAAAKEFGISD